MNRATFFKHFELVADHPDAVAKMRELVLELAVRGKLVSQNLKDEPASKLLDRICQEKDKLGKSGKNQADALPPVAPDETAFAVPHGWAWARTQHVTTYVQRGKSPKYSTEEKVPVIAQKCIQWHGFELHKAQFIEPASLESYSEDRFVLDGDLLWNSTGLGTLGRIIVFKDRFKGAYPRIVADSHVTVIRPSKLVVSDYLFLWFAGPKVQNEINAKASGSTKQTELATSTVLSYAIPLPPLAEQRRIVAKVDELMALCDELEQRQQARQHASGILQQSALHHLLAAREPQTFAAAWQRGRDHFHLLHDTPDAIPQLRQAILQLAVQGRLVPQNPKDEPAVELLGRLRKEKERLRKSGELHQTAPIPELEPAALAKPLPTGWAWCRFGDMIDCYRGHNPTKDKFMHEPRDGYVRFIQITDFKTEDRAVYVPISRHLKMVKRGEILMAAYRHIGKLSRKVEGAFNVACCKIIEIQPEDREFIDFLIGTTYVKGELLKASGRAHIPSMHTDHLLSLVIPLPPLAEQKRIVARVEELLRWCDTLEAQLHQTRTLGAHLLASTLHHLLAA